MKKLREFVFRVRALFHRERLDAEMREEMEHHLDMAARERDVDGVARDDARYAAQRAFGGVEQIKERCRDERQGSFSFFDQAISDLRFAARGLRKNRGFTAVALLTLALGIGATTALFTALDAILLRPLPVAEATRLVYLVSGRLENFSFPFYERMRDAAGSFSGFAAVQYRAAQNELVVDGGGVEAVRAQFATGNYFSVLRVVALHGRTFTADDDRPGAPQPVVVLSHAFWQRRFAGDKAVVGRSVQINQVPVTIIGVMPRDFVGFEVGSEPALWAPLQLIRQTEAWDRNALAEGVEWLVLFGRLHEGVSREQAQAEVGGIFRRQLEAEVASRPGRPSAEHERILSRTIELHSGAAGYVAARSQFKQPLLVLAVAVGVVLLIACTNIAGLLLARGSARQRELAVRAALGAGRARIMRQLITESMLLGLLGGLAGVGVAHAGVRVLSAYLAQSSGSAMALNIDARVLAFASAVSLFTGLVFGLAPALRLSRFDLLAAMKSQNNAVAGARTRLQSSLVVAQIALSVLLLAGAGLFARTLHNLRTIDLGFVPANLVTFRLDSGRWRPEAAQVSVLQDRLAAELETLPGVRSVAQSGAGMLSGNGYNTDFAIEGYVPAPDEELRTAVTFVGPRFFQATGVPLLRGREFTAADESAPPPGGAPARAKVVIIGEAMARRFFGDRNPIGRRITIHVSRGPQVLEILGVAKDTKYSRNLRERTPLQLYLPIFGSGARMPRTFYVRTEQSAAAIANDIRTLVTRLEPRMAVRDLRPMDEWIDQLLVRERIITQLVGFFSGFALLLAALGIYGVLSYGVAQRTREIGVRMALGATIRHVVQLVMLQGLGLVLLGCGLGLAAALGLTRFVTTLLYGVKPADPVTFITVAALLIAVAFLACWLPARRAAKVDPMTALRAE